MVDASIPWWRPDRFAKKRGNLAKRQAVLRAVRGYFENELFDEVETPALQVSPGLEPHLMAFQTVLRDPGERLTRRLVDARRRRQHAAALNQFEVAHWRSVSGRFRPRDP